MTDWCKRRMGEWWGGRWYEAYEEGALRETGEQERNPAICRSGKEERTPERKDREVKREPPNVKIGG